MMMRFFFLALALTLCIACNTNDERLPLLYGEWQGVTWSDGVNDNAEKASRVSFSFEEDFSYEASLGQQKESGDFVFRDSKLYTTATGDRKVEKVVAVESLEGDTLVFDMNRSGSPERLVLKRL